MNKKLILHLSTNDILLLSEKCSETLLRTLELDRNFDNGMQKVELADEREVFVNTNHIVKVSIKQPASQPASLK